MSNETNIKSIISKVKLDIYRQHADDLEAILGIDGYLEYYKDDNSDYVRSLSDGTQKEIKRLELFKQVRESVFYRLEEELDKQSEKYNVYYRDPNSYCEINGADCWMLCTDDNGSDGIIYNTVADAQSAIDDGDVSNHIGLDYIIVTSDFEVTMDDLGNYDWDGWEKICDNYDDDDPNADACGECNSCLSQIVNDQDIQRGYDWDESEKESENENES